jgi:protein-disulfide isomerase
LRNTTSLIVAAIIGAAMLTPVGALAGPPSTNVIVAQDDWARVPSAGGSKGPTQSSSPDTQPATATDHPQRGADNAVVTIVEYSDFQCPFCRRAEGSIRQVLKKYGDQVRLVYMDFPLPSHVHAMDAAIAARCANEQGQFWPYHDALFENPSSLSTDGLKATASQVGLDPMTFDACLEEHKFERNVLADQRNGEAAGVLGIPCFIVDGRMMHGASTPAAFSRAIDEDLHSR